MTHINTLPETGFVRERDLIGNAKDAIRGIIPFSHATLWRKVKAEQFPAPVKLSTNVTAWRVEDIRTWISNQV
ncbi:AlpA family transcriptional regulator [Pseudoduganella lurida]|uniref:AlpA family transcriptional regulator n=1 Tax=Pseudoduganella lurida TaxID=1036180 RepID=A0A562R9D8_9BURK|nr:AlpA family phage regulatory protein [Pseudoduganella lurida]TWI65194.1 AlpA family transcriptional regulator [Pseudoduganella lurida]